MVNSHSRVRDARSLLQHPTPTTLPLVGPARYVADGEDGDASGGLPILLGALLVALLPTLLIASFAVFAAARGV